MYTHIHTVELCYNKNHRTSFCAVLMGASCKASSLQVLLFSVAIDACVSESLAVGMPKVVMPS